MRMLVVTYDDQSGELRRASFTTGFMAESALMRADVLRDHLAVVRQEYDASVKEAFPSDYKSLRFEVPASIGKPEREAKKAIDKVAAGAAEVLVASVFGFVTLEDARHLRDFLWYASKKGVPVTFAPGSER